MICFLCGTIESCEQLRGSEVASEYVLVKFHLDGKVAVVPKRYIKESQISLEEKCTVTCPGRPRYIAELLFLGKYPDTPKPL